MTDNKLKAIVTDANVIIDYIKTGNKHILRTACEHLCELHIPLPVANEIRQVTIDELTQLGFFVEEPELHHLKEAASGRGKLSFQDMMCFFTARDNNWICATSDKLLKTYCSENGLDTMWGLELLIAMCKNDIIDKTEVLTVAKDICNSNIRLRGMLKDLSEKILTI